MSHPYARLSSRAFWKSAGLEIAELYRPKFPITTQTKIAAAGSCFAQHISREFKQRGCAFIDLEPPPRLLPQERWHEFGYDLYSARYGNIYSIRQLLQLVRRAFGEIAPQDAVWEQNGRFYDPYRPAIEPGGFESRDELAVLNDWLMQAVRRIVETCDVFVFTFGLTESWVATDGFVYPMCPGTVAGTFDPTRHRFCNFTHAAILQDAETFISLVRARNPAAKFLLTVSPVPLAATASEQHVLLATVYSKSVLRAVCGELQSRDYVDYFPSYEMAAAHPFKARFFETNMRSVSADGVSQIMNAFFTSHGIATSEHKEQAKPEEVDTVCEEVVLEAFAS
jgi:hypothetical protein